MATKLNPFWKNLLIGISWSVSIIAVGLILSVILVFIIESTVCTPF